MFQKYVKKNIKSDKKMLDIKHIEAEWRMYASVN